MTEITGKGNNSTAYGGRIGEGREFVAVISTTGKGTSFTRADMLLDDDGFSR